MLKRVMMLILVVSLNSYSFSQDDTISSITWSNDQSLLAIGRNNGVIEIFDPVNNQIISTINLPFDTELRTVWEPNNQRIATNRADGIVRIWDVQSGDLLNELKGMLSILDLEWSQNGTLYVSSLEGGTYIWDMSTYLLVDKLDLAAYVFSFSPSGEYLAVGSIRSFSIHDILSGINFHIQSNDTVIYTIWNPESTKLAIVNLAGDFSVWNLITNEFETTFRIEDTIPKPMHWQNNYLYLAYRGRINVWDTTTWQIVSSIPLAIDSFVSGNSTGIFYVEYNRQGIVEIATYCEIVESEDVSALADAILDGNSIIFKKQICLTENATYTLTTPLPTITGDISVIGNGATITMTGAGHVFDVAETGNLTLRDVTVIDGE